MADVLTGLAVDAKTGLSAIEASRRYVLFGGNELPEANVRSPGRILWEQFSATMVLVLLVAGLISLALADYKDAIAIFAIVVLNAAFGFAQEYRAEKAIQALRRLAVPNVKVRRDGSLESMPARDLVPGDVIFLEAGSIVGADCRIIEAANLQMSEAILTGESSPVEKSVEPLSNTGVLLGERRNMAYQGTSVILGRGIAVVTDTGSRTQLGRIAELLGKVEHEQTPMQLRMNELGRSLSLVALALVAIIFGLGLWRGEDLTLMFLTAVSMAVAAVPEGLPAVVTIALALGAQRMLRRRALIRRLPAVETLGSVTVICSDKTGTLTENRMTVTSLEAGGEVHGAMSTSAPAPAITLLLAAGAFCNDIQPGKPGAASAVLIGDPMEAALVAAAHAAGISKAELEIIMPRVAEIPFDATRKLMTTVHRIPEVLPASLHAAGPLHVPGGFIAFTKGAAESVISACDRRRLAGREIPLNPAARAALRDAAERLARAGQRVLGFAYRPLPSAADSRLFERDLIFIGLMGFSDPTRQEVKSSVQICRSAGIRPIMITGDHHLTAQHVARELGIGGRVLTGAEIALMPAEQLGKLVSEVSIYARVLPEHKFRIVEALQAAGHVVAMTGDGVNDAPALKQADIGVAMGLTGTDVSKQASDMVLLDDNFATIVAAVEEGRAIYDNIRKFIRYVLAGNWGEILVMLLGPLCGLPLPLLPLQILWINLASDGLNGLALSVEPPERDTMTRSPRSADESIFAHGIVRHIFSVGTLLGLASLGAGLFYWQLQQTTWQTAIFVILAFGQIFQTLAARSWRESVFRIGALTNHTALAMALLTGAATLAIVYLPFLQQFFGTKALPFGEMLALLALSTLVFWAVEFEKYLLRRNEKYRKIHV